MNLRDVYFYFHKRFDVSRSIARQQVAFWIRAHIQDLPPLMVVELVETKQNDGLPNPEMHWNSMKPGVLF